MKDYYEILGVDRNASEEDIKKAYKKLVVKWHPDRWVNGTEEEKKTAEEKIKEINEANSVLSDPEKRRNYDAFGSAEGNMGMGGSPFGEDFDPFDIFGRGRRRVERGADIMATVTLTMAESYTGAPKKEIKVKRPKPCVHCNGTGSADGKEHKCKYCNGTGQYTVTQTRGNMMFQQTTTCPHCHGTGKDSTYAGTCSHCHGTGFEEIEETVTIDIPAGVFDGAKTAIKGMGGTPKSSNGVPGDLIVMFRVMGEHSFERDGNDLVYNLELTLLEAWDGCTKSVTLPNGEKVNVTVPKNSKDGNVVRLYGRGFKDLTGMTYNDKGDFVAVIKYKVPDKITKEQHKLLEKFYEIGK